MAFQIYFEGRSINPSGKNIQDTRIAKIIANIKALNKLMQLLLSSSYLISKRLSGCIE